METEILQQILELLKNLRTIGWIIIALLVMTLFKGNNKIVRKDITIVKKEETR